MFVVFVFVRDLDVKARAESEAKIDFRDDDTRR